MLQGFAAVNKRLSSGGVLTGKAFLKPFIIQPKNVDPCVLELLYSFKNYYRGTSKRA